MRFLCVYKPAKEECGPPSQQEMAEIGKLIDEMMKEGTLLSTEGCQPSVKGARVRMSRGKITVVDGPFVETKELIGGYWIWSCASLDEAIGWAKKCPNPNPMEPESELEIRQLFELTDFKDVLPKTKARYQRK